MCKSTSRIHPGMSFNKVLEIISEGDPSVEKTVLRMLTFEHSVFRDLPFMDDLGIRGKLLTVFWEECCKRNSAILKTSLKAFREGKYTQSDIIANLKSYDPKPFV